MILPQHGSGIAHRSQRVATFHRNIRHLDPVAAGKAISNARKTGIISLTLTA
jgi:hypothetical protein